MEIKDIKTWVVLPDHKARPKNPFKFDGFYGYDNFEAFADQHIYHCSPSLVAGEYPAEMFELIWQYLTKKDVWFNYNDKTVFGGSYERYRVYMIEEINCVDTRENMQLKQLIVKNEVKEMNHYKGEVYYEQYTDVLIDLLYHRFYDQYAGKSTDQEKKEAFYEWLNEQIKNTTY